MIFLGGGIGSVLRYLLKIFCDKNFGEFLPYGTFAANILGSLFLGFVVALAFKRTDLLDTNTKLFLTVGIAGGFTTFSTYSLETVNLIKQGYLGVGIFYSLISLLLGVVAIYLGIYLAKYI